MPPRNWLAAVLGLMMRPQSNEPRNRLTRGAPGALEQGAAHRRHVADLRRGARHDGPGEHGIPGPHRLVLRDRGVASRRADRQAAVRAFLDRVRQAGDIDQRRGPFDRLAHQVDEVGAAAEVPGAGGGAPADRVRGVGGTGIGERDHSAASMA